jgi:signal transduction histidine kinase/DNA-binding response OmpR family regulator
MNALLVLVEILFGILFLATFVSYVLRRDSLSRDVMLIFAAVAGLLFFANLQALAGDLPEPVVGLAVALLLAAPLFTLRLTNQIQRVPRWLLVAAVVGYLLSAVPLIVLPQNVVGPFVLAGAAIFVLTDLLAAFYLARAAMRRVGAARVRLWSAAAASGLFAATLAFSVLGQGIPAVKPYATGIVEVSVLAVGLLYFAGFLPPAWLRGVWGAVAAFSFTEELLDSTTDDEANAVWDQLADLAIKTTGAEAAVIIAGERPLVVSAGTRAADLVPALRQATIGSMPSHADARRPVAATDPIAELAAAAGARYAGLIKFEMGGEPWALVLLRERPSLFDADDEAILRALIGRAAVFAERTRAMAEQAALAQRLAVTVEALEKASQAKSDFLASMSHELRTPLSAIIGFSALMREEPVADGVRTVPDEWIEHIHRGGEHLLALINDVLDLTKIEAGRIQLEPEVFELATALAESVEGLRPLADRKRITMTLDTQRGAIRADRGRLRQVVYNLLSNAIKFTPEEGRIDVSARWTGNDAVIVVRDSGVGIAAEDHERVFEEFRQVGDLKSREAGTGLGLALSRRLAEAHGGRITLDSAPGQGARFEVTLPDAQADVTDAPARTEQPEAPAMTGRVLIIEDDPGAVRLLRTYLEGEGYAVLVASDGESGLLAARRGSPDAILLDVLLPGMDGWEVLRRLKADEGLWDIPVVVVSVVDERHVAMRLGAADYLLKPFKPDALLARVARYTSPGRTTQGSGPRVLAIDDDAAARALIVNALRPKGFDVVAAASGQDGVALALEQPPELVICDLLMPDMNGYEVVEELHRHDTLRESTILILTGHELSAADRERLNGKVAAVLQKGVDPRQALARWLERVAPRAAASG